MSLTTSIITGFVTPPSNLTLMRGFVTFTISGFDTEGAYSIPAGANRVAVLGPDGSVPAGFTLWRNTEGLRATHYNVAVQWVFRDPVHGEHRMFSDLGPIQVGDNASYDLSELLDAVPVPLPENTYWRSITPYQYDQMLLASAAAVAAAEEATQGAEIVLSSIYVGAVEPDITKAGMVWSDTASNDVKIRNAANTAWLLLSDMIGALEYDRAQSLNPSQQDQVQSNMGLGAVAKDNVVPVSRGGTGATNVASARAALDVPLAPSSARIEAGQTSAGAALTTPAGGTWQWEADAIALPGGIWAQPRRGGIAGGGSVVVAAQAGIAYMYKFWRIA